MGGTTRRIAWFSPVPPDRSGIAAYTQELLPLLQSSSRSIDLFVDLDAHVEHLGHAAPTKYQALPTNLPCPAYSAQEFVWRHRRRPYDLTVYQMGNARCHDYMWAYLFRYPGLLVLHDLQVHQARAMWLLSRLEPRLHDYIAELAANHPGVRPEVGHLIAAGFGGSLFRLWPMTRLAIQTSRLTVVHNARLAARLEAEHHEAVIRTIEMGVTDPMAVARKPGLRERLGIPTDALVIGAFGGITAEKRVPQILGAVASVGQRERPVHVLLAGQRAAHYDLDADVRKFGLDRRVHVAGYVPDEDLAAAMAESDICACLRWPSNGETSASWLRALGAGRPTIITALAHLQDIPALQLSPDDPAWTGDPERAVTVSLDPWDEPAALPRALDMLCANENLRQTIGVNARRWWEAHHRLAPMAARYQALLEEAAARPAPAVNLPPHLRDDGESALQLAAFGIERPW